MTDPKYPSSHQNCEYYEHFEPLNLQIGQELLEPNQLEKSGFEINAFKVLCLYEVLKDLPSQKNSQKKTIFFFVLKFSEDVFNPITHNLSQKKIEKKIF